MKAFKKLNNLAGWTVWLIAAITYCLSVEPTASFWDCGEYIACAYRLEIGHPPGAPFFMVLGRFFALFGGQDPARAAFMINVLSALCSAFSILFLFWTITRLGIKIYAKKAEQLSPLQHWAIVCAGAIGSLAFTFSDTFWFNAVEGEVYAMSSLFTALVFWAILKWEEEDSVNPSGALRWLVLISYLIGLSIGVHLLSLLVIPAICFVIYHKKYTFSWKGFVATGLVSVFMLGFIQILLIPKIVKFLSDYEVFFTNKLHLGFSSGTVLFFLLLFIALTGFIVYTITKKERHYKISFYSAFLFCLFVVISAPSGSGCLTRLLMLGSILYVIHTFKSKTATLNAVFMSFATLLIGYSSFFVLVIRSQANPPMDENDPENAPNMLSYLLREQYGEAPPMVYGPYYNAPSLPWEQFGAGDPIYAKDKTNRNYRLVDSRKHVTPKYEKDYCTLFPRMYSQQPRHIAGYRYWGNVAEHHKSKMTQNREGQAEAVEIPSMSANLFFFFNYQVGYMYLRYFFWNFVGRQNDVQGSIDNPLDGNWVTGIQPLDDARLDTDTSQTVYRNKTNFAKNHFYALPLILGLCGMFFQFKRRKSDAWVVLCFFLFTGLAIIVYLNQSPFQVRERDYAYVGSFYAFAIWIGLGVLFLIDLFGKKGITKKAVAVSVILALAVPGMMAKEGRNDHDRSLRTLGRDTAINYLQSCAPNAILFTNGDCDTFPLWYAQEVENIRTDVRVICLSLLNTDWYIRQLRRAAYLSQPIPFTIPEEKLEGEKMALVALDGRDPKPVKLQDAMTIATSDDPNSKLENQGVLLDILPGKNFYIDVDSAEVVKNKVIPFKDLPRLEKRISWGLENKNCVEKSAFLILDLLAHADWQRPIYFTSPAPDACVGLTNYLQAEGLAYRFVPIRQNELEMSEGGRVNTDVMYDNIMTKFKWGGMNKKGVNLDENCLRMPMALRMQMGLLANALIHEGKPEKAKNILSTCLKEMPDETVPFDATLFNICRAYYGLGDVEIANNLAKKLFSIFEGDLKIYNGMSAGQRKVYANDIHQAKEILKNLTSISQQYGQEKLSQEFLARLGTIIPREELMPAKELVP